MNPDWNDEGDTGNEKGEACEKPDQVTGLRRGPQKKNGGYCKQNPAGEVEGPNGSRVHESPGSGATVLRVDLFQCLDRRIKCQKDRGMAIFVITRRTQHF